MIGSTVAGHELGWKAPQDLQDADRGFAVLCWAKVHGMDLMVQI